MIEPTTEALQAMARHVAAQLVADALKGMVGPTMTVTIHPQAPKLLAPATSPRSSSPTPAKRRGRKPGPKPKAGKARKWTSAQRAKFKASMAARRSSSPAAPEKRKPGRSRQVVDAVSRCSRCDHTEDEHDAQTGKCLSFRCSCAGFWK